MSTEVDPRRENTGTAAETVGASSLFLDSGAWRDLRESTDEAATAFAWLQLQSALIGDVRQAVVVLGNGGEGPYAPAANWPKGTRPSRELVQLAEIAMAERRSAARRADTGELGFMAVPLLFDSGLFGVVAFECGFSHQHQLTVGLRSLEWGAAQLELGLRRESDTRGSGMELNLRSVLENAVACLECDSVSAASLVLVNRLQTEFDAARVMLGAFDGESVTVEALSGAAQVNLKANLVRSVADAMAESIDQLAPVTVPAADGATLMITRAHDTLASGEGYPCICTIPVRNEGQVIAAITLERSAGFSLEEEQQLCQVAAICGPVLWMKRLNGRSLPAVFRDSWYSTIRALLGPRHAGLKAFAMVMGVILITMTFVQGTYRVGAPATLEGALERVITAPFAGYVSSAVARAGDQIIEGDKLASLEDKDLRLDLTRWLSQRGQSERQYLEAIAQRERAGTQIYKAQMDQAEAQIALLNEQVRRSLITAPFSAVIIAGDLSRSIGEPVERGQELFKIAPLNDYRVALLVDERDISDLAVGQIGRLVLASRPDETLVFEIQRITPVANASEGVNAFRVEAVLQETANDLRPGMTGTGKIEVGERRLIWVWTHRFFDWLRLSIWRWTP